MSNPTAKTFYEPLLKTIGELAEFKAIRPVKFDSTYEPICTAFGITLDQYGKQDGTDIYWVSRWIQTAFKDLTTDGLGVKIGRGQWALSEAGVQKALVLAGKQSQVVDQLPVTPANPVNIVTVSGVSIAIGPTAAVDSYHADSYIRFLALQESNCKGFFSEQSGICTSCTIQNACKNIKAAEFSSLAKLLDREDRQALLPAEPPASRPASVTSGITGITSKASGGSAQKILCQQASICNHCSTTIPQGASCYWVRYPEDGSKKLYHADCYDPSNPVQLKGGDI